MTFTLTGLVNSDTKASTEPSISTTAIQSSGVGSYPIALTGGADANYTITLVNGTLRIDPALLEIIAEDKSKIYGTEDPEFTYGVSGFKSGDGASILSGQLIRESGETVGRYGILQGTVDAGSNYRIAYREGVLEIVPARLALVVNPELIQTPWSVRPALPERVNILTADGQVVEIGVSWNESTLDLFKRGVYTLIGTLDLPEGILNEADEQAVLRVEVLAKPAPEDVLLSNNAFDPSPTEFFLDIGYFTVLDPLDGTHVISLVSGAADNVYFEIIDGILFWSSSDQASGKTMFTIQVELRDRDGNVLEKSFEITRSREVLTAMEVFNTFTPDGDGSNDSWGVPDLRYFKGVRVLVFDRGGRRLFYTEDPDLRWDGSFNGEQMPIGSYFWVIEVIETGEVRRGVLNLLKK